MISPAPAPKAASPEGDRCGCRPAPSRIRWFRQGTGAQYCCHGDLEESIANALLCRLLFAQANPGKLRIGEKAKRNLSARGHAVAASQVVANHAIVVVRDMRKLRTACHFTNRRHTRRCCFQPFVYADIPSISQFDARQFEPDVAGIRRAASRYQQMLYSSRVWRDTRADDVCALMRRAWTCGSRSRKAS